MDDVYPYPVFFECRDLPWEQKKLMEKYFRIRRRSGGGECGALRPVDGTVYSIAFKSQEDQQRVLQRRKHVVEVAGCPLEVIVRGSLEPHTSRPPDASTPIQNPQSIPTSTPPPSGEVYDLRPFDKHPGSHSSEKQTRYRQVDEAKLCLLWKNIECGLAQHFPGLKVSQRDAGQVVLEGSVADILEAEDWISDKEKWVLERRVSNLSPHLLTFLRKAYGTSRVLGDFLGVGEGVEIELRDAELRFFSLSADAVDEAAKKMQEKFKDVKIDLPTCSSVLPEIREKLRSKTNELNQEQFRAQVLFGSESTVCLVGHTSEVEELSETVTQLISQSTVHLLVPKLPEFLQLHDLGCPTDAAADNTARGATAGAPGHGVHVEIVQGTIETQQVDALVSPMVGNEPLSTRVGNILYKMVGSQLMARFGEEAGEEMFPGDAVLVESLHGLLCNAVFFLNLIPWDIEQDGTAVQVLRLGVKSVLTSCEKRGFGSVALPVLGAGIALGFPHSVISRVLMEEVHAFMESRASRTPFLIQIVICPSDTETTEVLRGFQKYIYQPDQVSTPRRIVLLGKTGAGKSSLANTIFGEEKFRTDDSSCSGTNKCQTETRLVNGREITLIDTPGFFDTNRPEEELKCEVVRCITECAPGPHAFLIMLKVEKFTKQEQEVIDRIRHYFSDDALKYASIVFTHGEQLPEGTTIEEFVCKNKNLSELVKRCGGRCHVFDNKYWKNNQQVENRNNQFQVEKLLNTIDKMVTENNGGYYTNEMLQAAEKEVKAEEEHIRQSSENMSEEEIRKQAKTNVSNRFWIKLAGISTGVILGAAFGVLKVFVNAVPKNMKSPEVLMNVVRSVSSVNGTAGAAIGEPEGVAAVAAALARFVPHPAFEGGVKGGFIGYNACEGEESAMGAVKKVVKAFCK